MKRHLIQRYDVTKRILNISNRFITLNDKLYVEPGKYIDIDEEAVDNMVLCKLNSLANLNLIRVYDIKNERPDEDGEVIEEPVIEEQPQEIVVEKPIIETETSVVEEVVVEEQPKKTSSRKGKKSSKTQIEEVKEEQEEVVEEQPEVIEENNEENA